jgi:uncharacterized protein
MRWLAAGALALLVACGGAASRPAAPAVAPAEVTMKKYFVALLRRGPAWTAERTDESRRLGEGHMAHIRKMADAGKLILAGPFEVDRSQAGALAGIYVFEVDTLEEAQTLVAEDPAVQGGRFVSEVLPWLGPTGLTYTGRR